jgi:hypothetical protein
VQPARNLNPRRAAALAEALRWKRVLPNDAGASCEDSFPDPKAAAVLFRASLDLIPDTGMDAAANSRVLCQA